MIVFAAILPHPPILLPEIGQGREAAASATLNAYVQIAQRLRQLNVDRCILISSHGIVTLRRFHLLTAPMRGNLGTFGTPGLEFSISLDHQLVTAIAEASREAGIPLTPVAAWETSDHASAVPLTLLADVIPPQIAVVSMSFLDGSAHYEFGQAIGAAAATVDGNLAILASGDAVHTLSEASPYGSHPLAPETQARIERAIENWDPADLISLDPAVREAVDESIVSPTLILMGALHALTCRPRILSTEAPWGVGYLCVAVEMD